MTTMHVTFPDGNTCEGRFSISLETMMSEMQCSVMGGTFDSIRSFETVAEAIDYLADLGGDS